MNIGILGWWRAGNQGDFAIRRNLELALAPHRIVPIDVPFELTDDELRRLNLLDFLIVGGGGLFQEAPPEPLDTFDEWAPRLKTPIGALGVGFDTVAPRYRPAVNALVERAHFFYVRDQESHTLIQHPKVQLMPDLSFFSPFPQVPSERTGRLQPVCGVNLRAVPSLDTNRWIASLRRLPIRLRSIPFSNFGLWHEIETLRQLDPDCPAAFDPGLYRGLDLMIGTAFHSIMFAIQAAVPVIAIAGTPKVRRLLTELDLGQWMLGIDEWDRLPELVNRALENHEQITEQLHDITVRMTRTTGEVLADAEREIERIARPHRHTNATVSIVVLGSTSSADNRLTLASCLAQTCDSIETVFAGDGSCQAPGLFVPQMPGKMKVVEGEATAGAIERLNQGLDAAQGEYVAWVTAGDYYAPDAIRCMLAYLEQNPTCDMVFADYYSLHSVDYVANAHSVDSAWKLFRGNVVGPCFLFRRTLLQGLGPLRSGSPYAAYDFWLRAAESYRLHPLHARLFFTQEWTKHPRDRQMEHLTRHQWRSTLPWHRRVFWRLVDSDLAEHHLIPRFARAVRQISAFFHHNR